MKRMLSALPLACAALLLSGCPEAKLPSPTPSVPTPKAQSTGQAVGAVDMVARPDGVQTSAPAA